MTSCVAVAVSHLSWPSVALEWTSVPLTLTSKLPVLPSSDVATQFAPAHSVSIAALSALAYLP